MSEATFDEVAVWLAGARRVAVLTGAGISAESGVPTFRGSDGLWKQFRAETLATPEAFERDPALVWEWYDWRRGLIGPVEPNPGHRALAGWEGLFEDFTVITQNVDGLHAKAGSRNIVELHGNIWKLRCPREGTVEEVRATPLPSLPPVCPGCGALLRPHVVWFGEALPGEIFESAFQEAAAASLFLVAGTSALVEPAASLARIAASHGAEIWEINPEETPLSELCDKTWRAPAGEVMDEVVDLILARCRG